MIHAAKIDRSPRLNRVLRVLRDGREHTSWELQMEARELRANGYAISRRQSGRVHYYQLEGE
jgi:hypothetical protein